jgi:hypothetical protein
VQEQADVYVGRYLNVLVRGLSDSCFASSGPRSISKSCARTAN